MTASGGKTFQNSVQARIFGSRMSVVQGRILVKNGRISTPALGAKISLFLFTEFGVTKSFYAGIFFMELGVTEYLP